jgi:hypothetical protein
MRCTLHLSGFEYPVYWDAAGELQECLYIRIPTLSAETWSNGPKHSVKLVGEGLQGGITILGLKDLRPYFLESSRMTGLIPGQAKRERLREVPRQSETLVRNGCTRSNGMMLERARRT